MRERQRLVGAISAAGMVVCLSASVEAGRRMRSAPDPRIPSQATVRLLFAGSSPRRAIRYHFRAGTSVIWRMEMKTQMRISMGGIRLARTTLPTSQTFMTTDVRSVDARRRATVDVRVTRVAVPPTPGVAPAQMAIFRKTLLGLVGFRCTSVVTTRGVVESARFHYPAAMTARSRQVVQGLEQQMRQLTTQLPARPVGLGARWRVRIPILGPPLRFVSVLDYRLLRRTRERVEVAVRMRGLAPPQDISFPGRVFAGVRLRLRSMAAHGKGRMTFSLDRPAVTGSLTAEQRMDSELRMGAIRRPMKLGTHIEVSFR